MIQRSEGTPISFRFHPFNIEKGEHVVEKTYKGVLRRYLRGISSGILRDGHGERMTTKCLKSMHKQGKAGDILLFAGLHGVNFVDDVGVLTNSDVIDNRDWLTEYMLHDPTDGFDPSGQTMENVDKLWKQVNGFRPYKHPVQKGFSVEGIIPDGSILDGKTQKDGRITERVIDDMTLDGVVVVSRPAYLDSVVTAVYKALKELPPQGVEKLHKNLHDTISSKLADEESKRNFYQQFYLINDVLIEKIESIMAIGDGRESQRLDILLDEYKTALIPLILQHGDVFRSDPVIVSGGGVVIARDQVVDQALQKIASSAVQLTAMIRKKSGGR